MSAWDPWWVVGDYAETYHGAPEEDAPAQCPECGGRGFFLEYEEGAWPAETCRACDGGGYAEGEPIEEEDLWA